MKEKLEMCVFSLHIGDADAESSDLQCVIWYKEDWRARIKFKRYTFNIWGIMFIPFLAEATRRLI